jgi:hypothetical protein
MNKPKISKNLFTRIHNVNVLKRKKEKFNIDSPCLGGVDKKIDILSNYIKNDLDAVAGFFCENFPNEVFTADNVFNFVRERVSNDLLTFEERREVLSEISFHLERNKSFMFVMDNFSGRNGFMNRKPFISP